MLCAKGSDLSAAVNIMTSCWDCADLVAATKERERERERGRPFLVMSLQVESGKLLYFMRA